MDGRGENRLENFFLWIDSVGAYWVCPNDSIILGQPSDRCRVDVPILGDLSQRHARIRRDSEGYVIEAIRETKVGGKPVVGYAMLTDGCEITLGETVRLRFRRPHALSASARLEFVSPHRTAPKCDAALLMADSCLMGPQAHNHILCRRWEKEIMIFRHDDEMFCRTSGELEIDGVRRKDRGKIHMNSQVRGEGFSFKLEPIPRVF